jgi:hypothetical protein
MWPESCHREYQAILTTNDCTIPPQLVIVVVVIIVVASYILHINDWNSTTQNDLVPPQGHFDTTVAFFLSDWGREYNSQASVDNEVIKWAVVRKFVFNRTLKSLSCFIDDLCQGFVTQFPSENAHLFDSESKVSLQLSIRYHILCTFVWSQCWKDNAWWLSTSIMSTMGKVRSWGPVKGSKGSKAIILRRREE